jgi:hypothetical protein
MMMKYHERLYPKPLSRVCIVTWHLKFRILESEKSHRGVHCYVNNLLKQVSTAHNSRGNVGGQYSLISPLPSYITRVPALDPET